MKALLMLLSVTIVTGASLGPEPICSKFHFEEQLLEKMIRTEVKVEEMEKRYQQINQNVLEVLEDLKTERKEMKEEYAEHKEQYVKEMEEQTADFLKLKEAVQTESIAFKAGAPTERSLGIGQSIVFAKTMFNHGEAYDNTTGVFTPPLSGTYLFTIHLCVMNSKSMFYAIVVNNVIQTSGRFYDSDATQCNSADLTIFLTAGENVSVKCLNSVSCKVLYEYSSPNGNYWSTFSGVLIHR